MAPRTWGFFDPANRTNRLHASNTSDGVDLVIFGFGTPGAGLALDDRGVGQR